MIARKSRCICGAGRKDKAAKKPGMFRCITPGINLALGADSLWNGRECLSLLWWPKKENGPSLEGRGQFGQVIRRSAAEVKLSPQHILLPRPWSVLNTSPIIIGGSGVVADNRDGYCFLDAS